MYNHVVTANLIILEVIPLAPNYNQGNSGSTGITIRLIWKIPSVRKVTLPIPSLCITSGLKALSENKEWAKRIDVDILQNWRGLELRTYFFKESQKKKKKRNHTKVCFKWHSFVLKCSVFLCRCICVCVGGCDWDPFGFLWKEQHNGLKKWLPWIDLKERKPCESEL